MHVQVKHKSSHARIDGEGSADELSGGAATSDRQHPGAHKKAGRTVQVFSAEQQAELEVLFEKHGVHAGYIDAIAAEVAGGVFKRSQVQRQLKVLGLKKGLLTENQARPTPLPLPEKPLILCMY